MKNKPTLKPTFIWAKNLPVLMRSLTNKGKRSVKIKAPYPMEHRWMHPIEIDMNEFDLDYYNENRETFTDLEGNVIGAEI